jgi:uncharacterized membrane protein
VTSHGYTRKLFDRLKTDVREIYLGGPNAEALIDQHGVDYIYVGPGERNEFRANESYFAANHSIAYRKANISIYKIERPHK